MEKIGLAENTYPGTKTHGLLVFLEIVSPQWMSWFKSEHILREIYRLLGYIRYYLSWRKETIWNGTVLKTGSESVACSP